MQSYVLGPNAANSLTPGPLHSELTLCLTFSLTITWLLPLIGQWRRHTCVLLNKSRYPLLLFPISPFENSFSFMSRPFYRIINDFFY